MVANISGRLRDLRDPLLRIKTFYQRGRRGWADNDVWSLDRYLSKVIAGSIAHLREHTNGHPCELTPEEWEEILLKIEWAFKAHALVMDMHYSKPHVNAMHFGKTRKNGLVPANIVSGSSDGFNKKQRDYEEAVEKQAREQMQLFVEYFGSLWW